MLYRGLFVRDGQAVRFCEAPPPGPDQIESVVRRVRDRAVRWLRRHGHIDERLAEERGNDLDTPTPIEACLQLALSGGTLLARPSEAAVVDCDAQDFERTRTDRRFCTSCDGFDLECAARVGQGEDERRERLVRYSTPSSFARWGTPAAPARPCRSSASSSCPTAASPTG